MNVAVIISLAFGAVGLIFSVLAFRGQNIGHKADLATARQSDLTKQADNIIEGLRIQLTEQAKYYNGRVKDLEAERDYFKRRLYEK